MPAWIHPIRLTSVNDACERLKAICAHLGTCVDRSDVAKEIIVGEHFGVESNSKNRDEISNCANHAALIVDALEWASNNSETSSALVTECHGAQSSGGADLVLLNQDIVWLFEASTSARALKSINDRKKLANEACALLQGKRVKEVRMFRVIPKLTVKSLSQNSMDSIVMIGNSAIVRVNTNLKCPTSLHTGH